MLDLFKKVMFPKERKMDILVQIRFLKRRIFWTAESTTESFLPGRLSKWASIGAVWRMRDNLPVILDSIIQFGKNHFQEPGFKRLICKKNCQ